MRGVPDGFGESVSRGDSRGGMGDAAPARVPPPKPVEDAARSSLAMEGALAKPPRSDRKDASRSRSLEGDRLMGSGFSSSSIVSITPSWELGRFLPPLGSASRSLLDRTTTCDATHGQV